MSNIADPLTRATRGQVLLARPSIRAMYGLVDFFKHLLAPYYRTLVIFRRFSV